MTIQEQYEVVCNLEVAVVAETDSETKSQKLDYIYNLKNIIALEADNKGIKL